MSVFLSQEVIEDKIFPNFLVLNSLQAYCYLQSQVISFLSFLEVHFANLPCLLINFKLSQPRVSEVCQPCHISEAYVIIQHVFKVLRIQNSSAGRVKPFRKGRAEHEFLRSRRRRLRYWVLNQMIQEVDEIGSAVLEASKLEVLEVYDYLAVPTLIYSCLDLISWRTQILGLVHRLIQLLHFRLFDHTLLQIGISHS